MSERPSISYRFDLPDGTATSLDLHFDPVHFKLQQPTIIDPPFWTELDFCKCANCPLDAARTPHCPAALSMSGAVEPLKALVSFDELGVTVAQAGRTVHAQTSAQQAMSSVLGLIMATSGCPWTDHLRPMARFHQPFAGEAETVYRIVSMFMLARLFVDMGESQGFAALESLYANLHVVNRDMSRRLGAATKSDPARNALALLDAYSTLLPAALESMLEELKPLFDAWQNKQIPVI